VWPCRLNTNAHKNVRGDPYVTFGPFLPAIFERAFLERYIGSRCSLLHKTSVFMLVFSITSFLRPPQISVPARLTNLYSCSGRASIWITWNFISKFPTWLDGRTDERKDTYGKIICRSSRIAFRLTNLGSTPVNFAHICKHKNEGCFFSTSDGL
jgi:hypothetical protein